jgi:hypothetical protein
MPDERHLRNRVNEREGALRRLRTTTRFLVVAATALAGVFAGLAAQKATARKSPTGTPARSTTKRSTVPAPPSLGAAPAAPAQVPDATSSPPVVSSGGS